MYSSGFLNSLNSFQRFLRTSLTDVFYDIKSKEVRIRQTPGGDSFHIPKLTMTGDFYEKLSKKK